MNDYKALAERFFDERAVVLKKAKPTIADLCYVSGRNVKVWNNEEMLFDLRDSIVQSLDLNRSSTVLEVGCAAGFIANIVAPCAKSYEGIDISKQSLKVAERLELPNATFTLGDGGALPYPTNSFDATFCYDVITNFPSFQDVSPIIKEMIRVTKPQGKILIGSIPDQEVSEDYVRFIPEYEKILNEKEASEKISEQQFSKLKEAFYRFFQKFGSQKSGTVSCYYFKKQDFLDFGKQLNLPTKILSIHKKNPYANFRFNVIYTKQ